MTKQIRPNLTRCMTRCGTVNYMAPEVHHYLGHGRPADFLYDMMCADSPVKQWRYKDPINYPSFLSTEAVSLLQGLLQTGVCVCGIETFTTLKTFRCTS